jgi:hypothetical protein
MDRVVIIPVAPLVALAVMDGATTKATWRCGSARGRTIRQPQGTFDHLGGTQIGGNQ